MLRSGVMLSDPFAVPFNRSILAFVLLNGFCCSEREYQRGDEIAWYADGDKIVRNEYNPATAYAFGTLLCYVLLFNFIDFHELVF